MSTSPRFRPVVITGGRREAEMGRCPSEDALILYASSLPQDELIVEELLEGWTPEAVALHLAGCHGCRRVVEETGALTADMRGDALDEPSEAFWDEMAEDVMRSLEMPARVEPEQKAEVIQLPNTDAPIGEPRETTARRVVPWVWAVAAAVLLAASLGIALYERPREAAPLPVADAPEVMPDRAAAEALAAELGLSLDPIDPVAAAEAEVIEPGAELHEGGLAALFAALSDSDVENLSLALADDDPLAELADIDAQALASAIDSLES